MRSLKRLIGSLVGAAVLGMSGAAHAVPYDFLLTFDGVTVTVDPTSDPIAGTSLVPGDTFTLDIHADPEDFWEITSNSSLDLYATFFVQDSGTRVGDITTTLFLDGIQVLQNIQNDVAQEFVHIGGQTISLGAGTLFDQLVIDYIFTSTTSSSTTIQSSPDVVHGFLPPFFRDANVAYVEAPTTVPEPSTLAILGAGLAGIGFVLGWRRHRAAWALP